MDLTTGDIKAFFEFLQELVYKTQGIGEILEVKLAELNDKLESIDKHLVELIDREA